MVLDNLVVSVIISALSGSGAGLLLIHFLGKRLINHGLDRNIEKYRNELATKIEEFKTRLSILEHKKNIAASRIDSQQADAISKIYACIRGVINPVSSLMGGSPIFNGTDDQNVQFYIGNAIAAREAVCTLVNAVADLAIFFDNATHLRIIELTKIVMDATRPFVDSLQPLVIEGQPGNVILKVVEEQRAQLIVLFSNQIVPIARELTDTFRIQLGVEQIRAI